MAPGISTLHSRFIQFAASMPAVGISWSQVDRDVSEIFASLTVGAVNPTNPSPALGNIPMAGYGLAYSVFLERLSLGPPAVPGGPALLDVAVTANVHPLGQPAQVIRTYHVQTNPKADVGIRYDQKLDRPHAMTWAPAPL
jgi:hypothetical protein